MRNFSDYRSLEKWVAKTIDGYWHSSSGRGPLAKGDGKNEQFLYDSKLRSGKTGTISNKEIKSLYRQAIRARRSWLFVLGFKTGEVKFITGFPSVVHLTNLDCTILDNKTLRVDKGLKLFSGSLDLNELQINYYGLDYDYSKHFSIEFGALYG